jgi:hypothetical protein
MEEKTTGAGTGAPHMGHGCFLCEVALPMIERCWPEDVRHHFRNSRVEFLKGLRSMLDARIASLATEEPKGTHVTVE